jgi:hypothetical protein
VVGAAAHLTKLEYQLAPRLVELSLARFGDHPRQRDAPLARQAGVHGGCRRFRPRAWRGAALACAAVGTIAAGALLARRQRRRPGVAGAGGQ